MASVRSTIELVITGATRGLAAASAEAEAMAERVGRAEDRVSAARTRAAAAEDRVGAAEARLQSARQTQDAALSRIGVAETNLARVRENSNGATTRLSQAEDRLEALRRGGGSAETIARAEADVARVRTESDRAAQALQRAEAQLGTARANAQRSSAQVRDAEAGLARARSDAVRASEASARAENDLNNLRRRGNQDVDRQRSGLAGLFDAFSRLGNALTGADDAANRFLSTGAALQNLFGTIGGPIIQTVFGIIQLIALFGALGEIVGVVGGLLGQALAGVPALLFAVSAAGATVLIGMDGIKKAAEQLKGPFDRLKASVSQTFQETLTPVFRQLVPVINSLKEPLSDMALSFANIAIKAVDVVATKAGMQQLAQAIGGASAFVNALADGFGRLLSGILAVAASAISTMKGLGQAVGSVFAAIGDTLKDLAADGTINAAIEGLSATIVGLGQVAAAVIDVFIRMGAALGNTFGASLTHVAKLIEDAAPFFEHLAFVAGDLLVSAFDTIGPAIERFIGNGIGPANSAMDQFASFMKDTVFPAVRDFIDWLSGPGLAGAKAFALGLVAQFTSAASGVLQLVSGMLGALRDLFTFLAASTGDQKFLGLAEGAEKARVGVEGLKTTMDGLHDKAVTAQADVKGADAVKGLANAIFSVNSKTVSTISQVFGLPENQALTGAIDKVLGKIVSTVSNVPGSPTQGTQGNIALSGAIGAVINKTVTTIGDVPGSPTRGTFGNQALKGAIDQVNGKTVTVNANVNGTSAVQALVSAINQVHSATATVTTIVRQITQAFAGGGQAPGGVPILVGEQGPELIMLPPGGGFVHTASQTRALLARGSGISLSGDANVLGGGSAPDPVTVTVNLSQDVIAGIAEVVIQRRDRTTKRTVLAGSGVTF